MLNCILLNLGSEPPADLMDNIDCLSNGRASFWAKLSAIGRLLWYFPGFLWRNPVSKGVDRIERVIRHVRQPSNVATKVRVAVQGYCWGGRIAVLLAGRQSDLMVDTICAAHPGGGQRLGCQSSTNKANRRGDGEEVLRSTGDSARLNDTYMVDVRAYIFRRLRSIRMLSTGLQYAVMKKMWKLKR